MTDQLTLAFAARDAGMAQADSNADDWDRAVVDQAILAYAETGRRFSANTFRDHLPQIRNRNLIGARCSALAKMRPAPIVAVGKVISNDEGTHGKEINEYLSTAAAAEWGVT